MKLSRIVFLGGLSSLALSGIVLWQRSNATPTRQTDQSATVQPSPTIPDLAAIVQPSTLTVAPSPTAPAPSLAVTSQANFQTITTCNGQPGNANFRAFPSLAPASILGVVAQGQSVYLTGRTVIGDGKRWYEAIAPGSLHPSTDPDALNQIQAGQTGWVAVCFVSR